MWPDASALYGAASGLFVARAWRALQQRGQALTVPPQPRERRQRGRLGLRRGRSLKPRPGLTIPTMPLSTLASPSAKPWDGFARRGLRNQAVCAVIALLVWLLSPGGRGNLLSAWIYSAAIGTLSWLFIDGGRLLLAGWLPGRAQDSDYRRSRWPGPGWMLLCILVGTSLGYTGGTAIGDALTGLVTPSLLHNRGAIAISIIAAIAATWYFYANERLRAEQAATEAARREAAEAQLMLLQSQLEPHMLFNTLANLRVLITLDPPRAQAMLDRLIGYLRATLGASRGTLHPLSAEFDRLSDYLALMALRMGPRLQVSLDLPAALRDMPVPPLLLQPLVENSIRHGLEPKLAGGRIEVRAEQRGLRLLLTVRDTGLGLAAGSAAAAGPAGAGTVPDAHVSHQVSHQVSQQVSHQVSPDVSHYGSQHVAARLATMYGAQAIFTLAPAADAEGGMLAVLDLPLPAPSAAARPAPQRGPAAPAHTE